MPNGDDEKLRLVDRRESSEIRKMWYQHVLATVEKLEEHINNVSDELRGFKDKLLEEVGQLKETIQRDMAECRKGESKSLDKLEEKISKKIASIERRLEKLEDLEKEDIKDLKNTIDDLKKEEIEPLKKSITATRLKLASISAGVAVVIWIILFFGKPIFSKILEFILKHTIGG